MFSQSPFSSAPFSALKPQANVVINAEIIEASTANHEDSPSAVFLSELNEIVLVDELETQAVTVPGDMSETISTADQGDYAYLLGGIVTEANNLVDDSRGNYRVFQSEIATSKNYLTSSDDLTSSAWNLSSLTVTRTAATADPFGGNSAFLFTVSGTGIYPNMFQSKVTGTSSNVGGYSAKQGDKVTLSIYAKNISGQYVTLVSEVQPASGSIRFDMSNQTFGAINGSITDRSITSAGNGWYRLSVTWTVPANAYAIQPKLWIGGYDGTNYSGQQLYFSSPLLEFSPAATSFATTSSDIQTNVVSAAVTNREYLRKNLLSYSNDFSNATWYKGTTSTVTANATTAPDGTSTASKLVESTTSDYHFSSQNPLPLSIGTTVTFSVYAKAAERYALTLQTDGSAGFAFANFNLSTGVAVSSGGGATNAAITSVGNGWYRCSYTFTTTGFAAPGLKMILGAGTAYGVLYTGDGTSGLYIWDGQIEISPTVTAYVDSDNIDVYSNTLAYQVNNAESSTLVETNTVQVSFISDLTEPATSLSAESVQTIFVGSTIDTAVSVDSVSNSTGFASNISEVSGKNLIRVSDDLANALWNSTVVKTSSNNISPDNQLSALLFTSTGTGLQYIYEGPIPVSQNTAYTFSFYAKLGTLASSDWLFAVYNETTLSWISVDVAPSITLDATWQRVTYTFTTPLGCAAIRVYPFRNFSLATVKTGYVWGPQLELGSSATSYVAGPVESSTNLVAFTSAQQESAPRNLLADSNNFAVWGLNGGSLALNSITSPDGRQNASVITGGAGFNGVNQGWSTGLGGTYTYSVYLKYISGANECIIGPDANPANTNRQLYVNIQAGTIAVVGPGISSSGVVDAGNGWFRFYATWVQPSAGVTNFVVYQSWRTPTAMQFGVYGAQVEYGSALSTLVAKPLVEIISSQVNFIALNNESGTAVESESSQANFVSLAYESANRNLLGLVSEDFSQWSKNTAPNDYTVSTNVTTAPNGTNTADLIVKPITNGSSIVYKVFPVNSGVGSANTAYVGSVYLKAGGYSKVQVNFGSSAFNNTSTGGTFDLVAGTNNTVLNGSTVTITAAGNSWWRIIVTATSDADGGNYVFGFTPLDASYNSIFIGDGTSGVYAWGAQVELGTVASAYTASSVSDTLTSTFVASTQNAGTTRKNLFTYSENLSDSAWQKANATMSSGITDPDGGSSAYQLVESNTLAIHEFRQSSASLYNVGTTYTLSVYVKANGRTQFRMNPGAVAGNAFGGAFFDLNAVTATGGGGYTNANITSIGNGWYRCSVNCIATPAGNIGAVGNVWFTLMSSGVASYTGDGLSGMYFWRPQLEEGSTLTSWSQSNSLDSTDNILIPGTYYTVESVSANDGAIRQVTLTSYLDDLVTASDQVFNNAIFAANSIATGYANHVDSSSLLANVFLSEAASLSEVLSARWVALSDATEVGALLDSPNRTLTTYAQSSETNDVLDLVASRASQVTNQAENVLVTSYTDTTLCIYNVSVGEPTSAVDRPSSTAFYLVSGSGASVVTSVGGLIKAQVIGLSSVQLAQMSAVVEPYIVNASVEVLKDEVEVLAGGVSVSSAPLYVEMDVETGYFQMQAELVFTSIAVAA